MSWGGEGKGEVGMYLVVAHYAICKGAVFERELDMVCAPVCVEEGGGYGVFFAEEELDAD